MPEQSCKLFRKSETDGIADRAGECPRHENGHADDREGSADFHDKAEIMLIAPTAADANLRMSAPHELATRIGWREHYDASLAWQGKK